MLYQLSYSPKELGDLAALLCGYSSAVRRKRTFTLGQRRAQVGTEKKKSRTLGARDEPTKGRRYFFAGAGAAAAAAFSGFLATSLRIAVTTPAPTVLPPSRIAKRRPASHAISDSSSTSTLMPSPGITISVPAGSVTVPVTSVVRK